MTSNLISEAAARLIRPTARTRNHFGHFGGIRQLIESVFETLMAQRIIEQHFRRTPLRVYARLAGSFHVKQQGIQSIGGS